MVPEIFLHLGIQVKINIANCEEGVMGPGCWALKRKADQQPVIMRNQLRKWI